MEIIRASPCKKWPTYIINFGNKLSKNRYDNEPIMISIGSSKGFYSEDFKLNDKSIIVINIIKDEKKQDIDKQTTQVDTKLPVSTL